MQCIREHECSLHSYWHGMRAHSEQLDVHCLFNNDYTHLMNYFYHANTYLRKQQVHVGKGIKVCISSIVP